MEMDYTELLANRDCVFIKLPLARALLTGIDSEVAELSYLDHLFRWNNFYEDYPKKRGPNDFLNEFRQLADSVKENGFIDQSPRIAKNADGQLASGSHRMSIHLALTQLGIVHQAPTIDEVDFPSQDYGLHAFQKSGLHAISARQATIEKINFFREECVPLVIIWPKAQRYRKKILDVLSEKYPYLTTGYDVKLYSRGLKNLVSLVYRDEDWAKSPRGVTGKFVDVAGDSDGDPVTMIVLDPMGANDLRNLKEEIRGIWGSTFQGIHTTDSWEESLRIFSTLSSRKSSALLEMVDPKLFSTAQQELISELGQVDDSLIGPVGYAVSGSQWLHLLGIRSRNDFDFIASEMCQLNAKMRSHNGYLGDFGFPFEVLVSEPQNHVWVMGRKHVSPWVYSKLISERGEVKDLLSIKAFTEKIDRLDALSSMCGAGPTLLLGHYSSASNEKRGPFSGSRTEAEIDKPEGSLASGSAEIQISSIRLLTLTIRWRLESFLRRLPLAIPLRARKILGKIVRGVLPRFRREH